ncbi:hypothetical protein SK128_010795 [Halocaridina rubra]|uniref:PKD/REJ-like domain-containing protein n=1 Tax=Halocaridina rubra TaxID=373956 RepID=A0AAN8WB95_HALRR
MEVTISKDDGREATAVTHVHLIADPVPLVNIRCVVESLCITRFGKIYINPSYRLGVVADCNVACDPPLMYEWVVADANDQPFVYLEEYFPVGIYKKELALSEKFLSKDVNMSEIHLSVQVQNNKGNKGEATFYLFIPKSPRNGVCTYYGPSVLKSLVENVTIVCTDWQDPEGVGIDKYQVIVTSEGQPEKVMNEVQHRSSFPNEAVVILSPGTYNISVRITNKWGTFSKVTVTEGLQVVMPSQEEFEQLQISSWVKSLTDSGNVALATMILGTQSAITGKAEWLKISNMIVENGTSASRAVDQMVINVAEQNNEALSNIIENTNFVSLSSVESASTAVASIMETASSKEASKTIDIAARDKVINIMENMMNSLETVDIPSSGAMQTLAQNILTASAGIMIGLSDVGTKEKNCSSASAADLKTADSLEYDTSLPDDINFEVPKTPEAALRCNVKGTVKNNAIEQTAKIDQMLTKLSKNIMEKCVVGEDVTITSPNGMAMTVSMMDGKSLGGTKNIGNSGAKIAFPKNFCPAGSCDNPVTMSAKEWPSVTNAYAKNAEALSPNSHVLDIEVFTRDLDAISVSNLEKPIEVILTRSVNEGELPEPVCVNATQESSQLQVPIIYSNVNVSREKLAVNLEITPDDVNDRLFMIISHSRMPTLRNHDFFQLITNLTERNGTYDWFLSSSALKGSGRYFVGIGQFDVEFDVSLMKDPIGNGITNDILQNITTDYTLRIFTSGCYFFDKELLEWSSNGMEVYKEKSLKKLPLLIRLFTSALCG